MGSWGPVGLGWEEGPAAVSVFCDADLHSACRGEVWDADGKNLPSEPPRSLQPQDI